MKMFVKTQGLLFLYPNSRFLFCSCEKKIPLSEVSTNPSEKRPSVFLEAVIADFFSRVEMCLKNGYVSYPEEKKREIWNEFYGEFDTLLETIRLEIQQKQLEQKQKNLSFEKKDLSPPKCPSQYSQEEWRAWEKRHTKS